MKKLIQPWEKLSVSELSYMMTYSSGYRSAFLGDRNPYKRGTPLHKIWDKGKREAKKI